MLTAIVQSVEVSTLKTSACLPIQIRIRRSTSGQTVRLRNAMASASQTSAVDRRRWRALPRYVPCAPMLIGQDEHPRARRQAARRAVYSVTRLGPLRGSSLRIPDARGTAVRRLHRPRACQLRRGRRCELRRRLVAGARGRLVRCLGVPRLILLAVSNANALGILRRLAWSCRHCAWEVARSRKEANSQNPWL